jgi:hypothetical protein
MNTDDPEKQRRQLRAHLAQLVTWLETDDHRPELFGSTDEYEWLLRLTTAVASLLARHRVDRHGRCEWCQQRRTGWRRFLPRWENRSRCHVVRTALSLTSSDIAVVWWQAFNLTGDRISHEAVRAWLNADDQPDAEPVDEPVPSPSAVHSGRHALPDDTRAVDQSPRADSPQLIRPYVGPTTTPTPSRPPADADTEQIPKTRWPSNFSTAAFRRPPPAPPRPDD